MRLKLMGVAMAAMTLGLASSGWAADVFLDWDGALLTMDAAWSDAGYSPGAALTPMEKSSIIAMAEGKIISKFGPYSVTFHGSPPVGLYEWVKLGSTTVSTTTYGLSSGIDWRNRVKDGFAEIYLANFGGILSSSAFTRAMNLDRFATAIANTTCHELGHNLGLQHYDAYGVPSVTAPGYAFTGEQNGSIMATGVTGLTAMMRGADRFFNPIELLKLEYADDVTTTLGSTVLEAAGDKSTLASAQLIAGTMLPISHTVAVNVDAAISVPGQVDIYKFSAAMGSRLSANTFSHGNFVPFTDTTLTLMDSSGTPLMSSTDINFFADDFMTGTSTYYSDDSLIFNFVPGYTGTYYLKVFGTVAGDYDLLVTGLAPVPEPATILAAGLGLAAYLGRRRRPRA